MQKGVNVFQMLIACQECKQFSGYVAEGGKERGSVFYSFLPFANFLKSDLGEALEHTLSSNKKLFWALLQELENGADLKFKVRHLLPLPPFYLFFLAPSSSSHSF